MAKSAPTKDVKVEENKLEKKDDKPAEEEDDEYYDYYDDEDDEDEDDDFGEYDFRLNKDTALTNAKNFQPNATSLEQKYLNLLLLFLFSFFLFYYLH